MNGWPRASGYLRPGDNLSILQFSLIKHLTYIMAGGRREETPQWLITSDKKRRIQAETIAPFTRLQGPANADAISGIDDIEDLAGLIAKGELRAFDVALAYVQKAAWAHEKVGQSGCCRRT